MPTISLLQLARVCTAAPIVRLSKVVEPLNAALVLAEATTLERAAMFVAQIAHESAEFRCTEENLSYSAEAIAKVFRHHFASVDLARPYARNPEKLANAAYADRMGNGPAASGDGWKFRGRGWLMATGKSTYAHLATALQLPLLEHPEILALPQHAAKSAAWFWRAHGLNVHADKRDVKACTHIINGGENHELERETYFHRCISALTTLLVSI